MLNSHIFKEAYSYFNEDMSNWNVSKVTNFFACFENSEFNQVLNWTTTAGEIYSYMFRNNKIF